MKMDKINLVKVTGWIIVAVGGIMTSWAGDKQTKQQIDENFDKYIEEKEKGDQ